ncbi:MAG: TadE/TadG family type IV pilus assembly protein [Novosphingobium sp.]
MIALRTLFRNRDGAAIVEFAMVSPLVLIMLLGCFDLGHGIYTKAMLLGSIEKVSRDSTIEAATTGALDAKVTGAVRQIAPGATVTFERSYYTNFSDVRKPEDFTDNNHDGTCGNHEPYEDANGNGRWDADRGMSGQGGARDAVLYKVIVSYPRVFPVARFLGQSNTSRLVATTVLRNQPYNLQDSITPTTRYC